MAVASGGVTSLPPLRSWRGTLRCGAVAGNSVLLVVSCATLRGAVPEVASEPIPKIIPDVTGSPPIPAQAVTSEAASPPQARLPALSTTEARRQLLGLQANYRLLTSGGEPALHLHDLDRDGQHEAFVVGLDLDAANGAPESWVVTLEKPSDFGRLHDTAIEPQAFTLLSFGNRHGQLWLAQETALGW